MVTAVFLHSFCFPFGSLPLLNASLSVLNASLPLLNASLPLLNTSLPLLIASIPLLNASLPPLNASLPPLDAPLPLLNTSLPLFWPKQILESFVQMLRGYCCAGINSGRQHRWSLKFFQVSRKNEKKQKG